MRKSHSGSTWIGALSLLLGFGILGLQAGLRLRPVTLVTLGLSLGLMVLVLFLVLSISQRRSGGAESTALLEAGPPIVEGLLDFSCLPGDWAEKAPEALGPLNSQAPAMNVRVRVVDQYLQIDKLRTPLSGKRPFSARVPLQSVSDVKVRPPKFSSSGSCLHFKLESGEEIRVEIPSSTAHAESVRDAFLEGAREPGWKQAPGSTGSKMLESGPLGLEVISPPPPARTSPAKSYLLLLACFVPFGIAMLNALEGPFAAVSAAITFFSALVLVLVRPPWMSKALAGSMGATVLAFAFDAWRVQRASHLVGAVSSAALAFWMLKAPRN